MKTNIRRNVCNLAKFALIFFIFLVQSCTSTPTSGERLEGDDFNKNLPGLWEGRWYSGPNSGKISVKIDRIDGNKVYLTGSVQGTGSAAASDEVYGNIEKSSLLLTWPAAGGGYGVNEEYSMIKDESNNLILDGRWKNLGVNVSGKSKLNKIE